MIDWRIQSGTQTVQEECWFFPSFPIQEFLLPMINVGFEWIDEYGDTSFHRDDCMRLKGNIRYLLDSGLVTRRQQIRYDSFEKGIVVLQATEIEQCLLKLLEAADRAILNNGTLGFYGD